MFLQFAYPSKLQQQNCTNANRVHGFYVYNLNLIECIYGLNLIKTYVYFLDLRVSSHPNVVRIAHSFMYPH